MRVSTINLYNSSLGGVLQGQEQMTNANEHLVTGKKLLSSADGPADMVKTMFLSSEITLTEQHLKNGIALENILSLQEGFLSSMTTSCQRARVLAIQSGDGINEAEERASLAQEMREIRDQLYEIMNSHDSSGNSVFSGHQNQLAPYSSNSGVYSYQGDSGTTQAKVSPSVYIQSNTTGADAFEDVTQRLTASAVSANIETKVDMQRTFDAFHKENYDSMTAANNVYQLTTTVGVPDTYEITDSSATVVGSGNYIAGEAIEFNGLEITLNLAAGSPDETITLDAPVKNNVLNTLTNFIDALEDPTLTTDEFDESQRDFIVGLDNSMTKIDLTVGELGARFNALDSVRETSYSIDLINKGSKAKISEIDVAEAASELSKAELALNTSYSSYGKLSQLSLFNYI